MALSMVRILPGIAGEEFARDYVHCEPVLLFLFFGSVLLEKSILLPECMNIETSWV